ncbi:MAG: di-trans,poly-cis-decaprenylcistransferase [Clostridiales Family XIII bacterium]|nr:di-trans,poly-cis-decaprenylcistransferase [Clostridiales Family XIII bacterium]
MVKLPRHIAIIMDGNGRWAKKHGKTRLGGHDAGMKAMKGVIKECGRLGIEHLTVYAFSTENWKRSKSEVAGIFGLIVKYMRSELAELMENNVVCDVLGDYTSLPKDAVNALDKLKADTGNNTGLRFHIALNYGSRADMLAAAKRLALAAFEAEGADAAEQKARIEEWTPEDFARGLATGGIPDPDLIIRTSGEQRLSNFLLWEAAYSELVFSDTLWPDFTPEEFHRALDEYARRSRRFGGR